MPNLFPVFDVPAIPDPVITDEAQYPKSVFFDYYKGGFVVNGDGTVLAASPEDTWKQWCLKVVYTERNAMLAYTSDIGTELIEAFSEPTRKAQQSAIEKTITEALLADPLGRTTMVSDFIHIWGSDSLQVTFTVTGKSGAKAVLTANLTVSP